MSLERACLQSNPKPTLQFLLTLRSNKIENQDEVTKLNKNKSLKVVIFIGIEFDWHETIQLQPLIIIAWIWSLNYPSWIVLIRSPLVRMRETKCFRRKGLTRMNKALLKKIIWCRETNIGVAPFDLNLAVYFCAGKQKVDPMQTVALLPACFNCRKKVPLFF